MLLAPLPNNEKERLEAVHKIAILDTNPEERFDNLTKEAMYKLSVPMSSVTIIDDKREWYKSHPGIEKKESERSTSFCGHALLAKDIFVVEDTLKDDRFADNPMVVGPPYIRFYAGIALTEYKTGHAIGVFCIKDIKPRKFNLTDMNILADLASRAEKELNTK